MSRTRARALALVNWKGVFYERYLLHRHVTALEGSNGAGKTTVMIAAYVVLLPDMSRLRFTNLGETGATGGDKGIWGRLGEPGRPSYAALDLELPSSERLLAGVLLARKAEPSVEPTPFIVTGLSPEARLQDLLLLRREGHDEVPELAELKGNATRLGAECQVFSSTKDYLNALFELGVTPLKLGNEEERRKFNEMLRTSMTGGISRALTSELRSFLLKEETGLGDALTHMKNNLEACRRTRIEVGEARRLDHEIAGIYAASERMVTAALGAELARGRELERARSEALALALRAEQELAHANDAFVAAEARRAELVEQLATLSQELETAEADQGRRRRARTLGDRLGEIEGELASRAEGRRAAQAERERATAERAQRASERDRLRDDYERTTRGLAHVQTGLEELHRHAHEFRAASERLSLVRSLLGKPEFSPDDAAAELELAKAKKTELDRELVRLDRRRELASVERADHERALAALRKLEPGATSADAHGSARTVLARAAELERLAGRELELAAALAEAKGLGVRQSAVRTRALALLGHDPAHDDASFGAQSLSDHLDGTERELGELRARSAELRRRLDQALVDQRTLGERAEELEQAARELGAAKLVLARITGGQRAEPWTHAAVAELKDRLLSEREGLRLREVELERERERSLRRAAELESEFGGVDPELLALCDELDAELLASRYDELEPEQAALVQARLGEISRALVVRDPEAVAAELAGKERAAQSVWLVGPGFGGPTELAVRDGEVLVRDGEAIRLTRLPARPTLGRSARARRAAELKVEAERLALELEAGVQRARRLDGYLSELTALIASPQCFAVADPEQLLAAVRAERATHASETERRQSELDETTRRATELEARVRELRGVLPDAFLLDGKDHSAHAAELALELEAARRAKQELAATREARSVLAGLLDALRSEPLGTDELARLEHERGRSETQRDLVFALCEALTDLLERRAALGWEQSAQALAERTDLIPTLEAEQREARRLLDAAEVFCRDAESAWEVATSAWQKTEGEWVTLDAHRAQQALLLEREGADDHSDAALLLADQAVEASRAAHAKGALEERRLATEIALLDERRKQLAAAFERESALREESSASSGPATVELGAMKRELAARGLERLEREAEVAFEDSASGLAEARTQRELLLERVSSAENGGELGEQLRAVFAAGASGAARAHLEAWLAVRAWLSRRIPSQIAQGADPLEGLERLRDHLAALERRLGRQEGDLRGASEDIARSVEAQLRRAKNQVRRLQQSLTGLSFGNIAGIRVQMRRVERMDQILKALQEGAAQEFLFQRGLPIEDALNEVFRRYGGGKSGGQRLLDYREYVELEVEIQRRSSETWEPANATRLSTGEAIGVGAALMMVVLTEWERDANLFRGRREHGSLRFLFLDEANRLSHDNLGTLFDLCRTLDLQLLIAAPEVARADGNTTYRLVRTVDSEGREEVIVSGRRTTSEVAQA